MDVEGLWPDGADVVSDAQVGGWFELRAQGGREPGRCCCLRVAGSGHQRHCLCRPLLRKYLRSFLELR